MGDQWVDLMPAIGTGESRAPFLNLSVLQNLMFLQTSPGSSDRFGIVNTPGLSPIAIVGSGSMRGMIAHGDYVWFVRGTQLRTYNDSVGITLVGTVSGTNKVQMCGAGINQIFIVDGAGNEYLATTATVIAVAPPAGDFGDCTAQDGYVVCTRVGTDEFYISGLDAPTSFAALDFSTADSVPDRLVGCVSHNRELFLFGEVHTEAWADTGASPFPFTRAAVINRGCYSPGSIAAYGDNLFFLDRDKRVCRMDGYSPRVVSTDAIDAALTGTTMSPGNVRASIYANKGQLFYVLSVSTSSRIYAYDITHDVWHLRTHAGSTGNYVDVATFNTSAGASRVYAAMHYISGSFTDSLQNLSLNSYTDSDGIASAPISRTLQLPWHEQSGRRIFESDVALWMTPQTTDTTLATGTVTFKYLDDDPNALAGFVTHSTAAMDQMPVRFTRCGSYHRRTHQFTIVSDGSIEITKVRARFEVGL